MADIADHKKAPAAVPEQPKLVRRIKAWPPEASNRAIAEAIGVSHQSIGRDLVEPHGPDGPADPEPPAVTREVAGPSGPAEVEAPDDAEAAGTNVPPEPAHVEAEPQAAGTNIPPELQTAAAMMPADDDQEDEGLTDAPDEDAAGPTTEVSALWSQPEPPPCRVWQSLQRP